MALGEKQGGTARRNPRGFAKWLILPTTRPQAARGRPTEIGPMQVFEVGQARLKKPRSSGKPTQK